MSGLENTEMTTTPSDGSIFDLASQGPSKPLAGGSVKSTLLINDIIQPQQVKLICELLDDIQAYSTSSVLFLANQRLSWLRNQNLAQRVLDAPSCVEDLHRVDSFQLLKAMLDCIKDECGMRYVAASIVSCGYELNKFIRLANTWFGLFLWPFREAEHWNVPESITPTYRDIQNKKRRRALRNLTLCRDDYICVVTRNIDPDGPRKIQPPQKHTILGHCHILKQAVVACSNNVDDHAVSLFDILKQLFPSASNCLKSLAGEIDSPLNSMTLSLTTNVHFDKFFFCLVPWPLENPEPNTYEVKEFTPRPLFASHVPRIITFEDHSDKNRAASVSSSHHLSLGGNGLVKSQGAGLPEPQFLEVHATVAHIMQLSGVDMFLSLLWREFGDCFPGMLVPKKNANEELDLLATMFTVLDLQENIQTTSIV